jgi:hypothetical protein
MSSNEQLLANPASIPEELRQLQRAANSYRMLPAGHASATNLHVFFMPGPVGPWRLVERRRVEDNPPHVETEMLVFERVEEIRDALQERIEWQAADARFVADHMATPGDFPGVTTDWVPTKDFDYVFWAPRQAIKREICVTEPTRSIVLG